MDFEKLASLQKVIETWLDENLEDIDMYCGEGVSERMTKAAASVLDAYQAGQKFYISEVQE
jgi:hypothetical protein